MSDELKEYSIIRHISSCEEDVNEHFEALTGRKHTLRSYVESFDFEVWAEDLKV